MKSNKILVINAGSSSLKFQLMDAVTGEVFAKGNAERIGIKDSFLTYKRNEEKTVFNEDFKNHKVVMEYLLKLLVSEEHGVIKSIDEIGAFGHRVVHGGVKHFEPCLVTDEVIKDLQEAVDLAPLHLPAHIMGIEACMQSAPSIKNVVVFDTGFHSQIPEKAFRYAIPKKDYEELKIRRYGFHGTSHYFISHEYAKIVGKNVEDLKIITAHLGGGCSISAVMGGHSVDTSMGFTPLEGLIMGTRSGDIDPAVVEYLSLKRNMTVSETLKYLNKQSGMLGLTDGKYSDNRDIEQNLDNPDCALALDMMCYRIQKYIGSYIAAMNGCDAIVFSGGIGERGILVREKVLSGLTCFGIEVDKDANKEVFGNSGRISTKNSKIDCYVVPTNEELVIAMETKKIVENK